MLSFLALLAPFPGWAPRGREQEEGTFVQSPRDDSSSGQGQAEGLTSALGSVRELGPSCLGLPGSGPCAWEPAPESILLCQSKVKPLQVPH